MNAARLAQRNGRPANESKNIINLVSDEEDDDLFVDASEEPILSQLTAVKTEDATNGQPQPADVLADLDNLGDLDNWNNSKGDIFGDYYLGDDLDEDFYARILNDEARQLQSQGGLVPQIQAANIFSANAIPAPRMQPPDAYDGSEPKPDCISKVLYVFPEICRDHVSGLYDSVSHASEQLIAHILDKLDKGVSYPKAKDKLRTLKRKREVDEDEEATRKYAGADRSPVDFAVRPIM